MTQDGTGLLPDNFPLQVMFTLLANSWCAERSFPMKTISSSLFSEYKYCQIILSRWIHIFVIISCVKTLYVLQNQSFFQSVPLVYVIFSNHKLQLVGNYVLKVVIKFAFCVVSLLWTSRYVLIDISNLTHFLCRNLFVMSCLTPSVNSDFHECFGNSLTITVSYSVRMVNAITNTL